MANITRKGDTIKVGNLSLTTLPSLGPSASEAAKIRANGFIPQEVSFSGEQVAASLETQIRNWVAMGWTINLRQKDGSLLKIDPNNPPAAAYTIKRDGMEIQ